MMATRDATAGRAVTCEAIKLVTLPMMALCTGASVVISVVVAFALHAHTGQSATDGQALRQVAGYAVVAPIVGGVCATTSEYTTRQVSRSVTSVPSRPLLLAAKALVVTCWAATTGVVSMFAAWLVDPSTHGSQDGRVLVMASLHMSLMALIAAAMGMLLRGVVASLAAALILLVVVPPLAGAATPMARWLPSLAGERLMDPMASRPILLGAALAIIAWTAGLWGCAAARFTQSDA